MGWALETLKRNQGGEKPYQQLNEVRTDLFEVYMGVARGNEAQFHFF